jgi:hypothetical protein
MGLTGTQDDICIHLQLQTGITTNLQVQLRIIISRFLVTVGWLLNRLSMVSVQWNCLSFPLRHPGTTGVIDHIKKDILQLPTAVISVLLNLISLRKIIIKIIMDTPMVQGTQVVPTEPQAPVIKARLGALCIQLRDL